MVLTIYRASRNTESELERIIKAIWEDPDAIYREERGVVASAEAIAYGFNMVWQCFSPRGNVRYHLFEVSSGSFADKEIMISLAHQLLEELSRNFQTISIVKQVGNTYKILFLLNAVSYQDGRKFHDNNQQIQLENATSFKKTQSIIGYEK